MVSDGDKFNSRTRHGKWMDLLGRADLASIIIPTFNRATLLEDALASAAAQTYRPLEIIVVDDGSTDNTPAVVDRWREKLKGDPQAAILFFRQENSGVGSARNRGLIESRGEFIQFLDSDDVLNPQKLSVHIACLRRHPECGYVFSGRTKTHIMKDWGKVAVDEATVMDSAELYCSPRVMMTMVGVYRRGTCCEAGPFCEDMSLGEDEEFNLRTLLTTERLVYLPGVLCAVNNHGGPRLTDEFYGRGGLVHWQRMYRRMVESAVAEGRLSNGRLVSTLSRGLTDFIIDALAAGCRDIADDAFEVCRKLPMGSGRRLRLAMYRIFGLFPGGSFARFWRLWMKCERGVKRWGSSASHHFSRRASPAAKTSAGLLAQPLNQTVRDSHPAGG